MRTLNVRVFSSPSASDRLAVAQRALLELPADHTALIVGASRAAADELAARVAVAKGALFGITRVSFAELVTRLAVLPLARDGRSPSGGLSEEALAARVAFEANDEHALEYFTPVVDLPGFPRALARTMEELRLAGISAAALGNRPELMDLRTLMARAATHREAAAAADYAEIVATATEALASAHSFDTDLVIMLDVALATAGEQEFVTAFAEARRGKFVATVPAGDHATLESLRRMRSVELEGSGWLPDAPAPRATPHAEPVNLDLFERSDAATPERSLQRLQAYLFSDEAPAPRQSDGSVIVFSAPGEGREAVEIARRVLLEAARGVPFDEIAILVRAPQGYLSVLEHALDRAGVPAWFHRGTRRPDPAGRALLALLACAEEGLSARRFAEYVSLSQVPMDEAATEWSSPIDPVTEAVVPPDQRTEDVQPEQEARDAARLGESRHAVAGTLRAPWRWEDLLVEAAVIGGIDRWERRLAGLANEYARRLSEAASDEPESPRVRALRRDAQQLEALAAFALPVLRRMAAWPSAQLWGDWLEALQALLPGVLRDHTRVRRVLTELAPLATVGPVGLREVRDVLSPRLSTLTHEPPRRRQGCVFVGTPHAARGRSFRVVLVPGLAERMFPQRIREDALLLDDQREGLGAPLATLRTRALDERLHLKLAVGAALERIYLSYPRIELTESRPRVPSFYVLDVLRAVEGRVPDATTVTTRAFQTGGATLAWPAPSDPDQAIDDFEHDLAVIGGVLAAGGNAAAARGRARYLYELSPELRRSLTARWLRWHRRAWEPADGLVRAAETTAPLLASQRLGARPYSLSALQKFAACPYQFFLSAIYRLAPLEAPAPLQRLDPLTRGDLFHRIQAHALRLFKERGLLPLTSDQLPTARKLLEWAVTEIEREARDRLAPAIDRVWRDEIAAMTRDLKVWLDHLSDESADWTPERFEFAFGLEDTEGRDPESIRTPARIADRFLLRGSIDLVERHNKTGFLRVTDHKTGRNRTKAGHTVVDGGRVLQPVIYGLALEALMPGHTVFSGRLFFCTSVGDFKPYEIPLLGNARQAGIEVLEIIDRAIARGTLAPRPAVKACEYCDFTAVCGRQEERRTGRKARELFADLDALRGMP